MKIERKLAGDCKGGDCPTVYATDRGTLVIQGYVLDPATVRQLTLPTGEGAVEVPAELLLEAARQVKAARLDTAMPPATPAVTPGTQVRRLSRAEFSHLFSSFSTSAFRLETLPEYRVEGEAEELALFLQGKPLPPDGNEGWCRIVAAATQAGKRMQRVHVIPRRLTPYLRFEIEWGYLYSAEAGEEILLLPHDSPDQVFGTWPLHDFWVFDDRIYVRMHYDEAGGFLFASLVRRARGGRGLPPGPGRRRLPTPSTSSGTWQRCAVPDRRRPALEPMQRSRPHSISSWVRSFAPCGDGPA